MVHVLTAIETYDEALSYAKENFEKYPSNPFFAQAYFDCLFHTSSDPVIVDTLQDVLDALSQARGARASEMCDTLSAKFEYSFRDKRKSFEMVDAAIKKYPGVVYPVLAALDMSINEMDAEGVSICIKKLENMQLGLTHRLAANKGKVVLTALLGDKARAVRMIKSELTQLSARASERLRLKIEAA